MSEAVEQRERAWSHQGTRVLRMAMQTFLDANPPAKEKLIPLITTTGRPVPPDAVRKGLWKRTSK